MSWDQAKELLRQQTNIRSDERDEMVEREIKKFKAAEAAHGSLHSGSTVHGVAQICADELRLRMDQLWADVVDVLRRLNVEQWPSMVPDLKHEVRIYLNRENLSLKNRCTSALDAFEEKLRRYAAAMVGKAAARAEGWLDQQIDLLAAEMSAGARRGSAAGREAAQIINVNAPVGAFQMGDGASANVVQINADFSKEQFVEALKEILRHVDQTQALPVNEKEGLKKLASDAIEEASKDAPARFRLSGLLTGLGQGIQTVGALPAAWQAVKAGAAALGINLP